MFKEFYRSYIIFIKKGNVYVIDPEFHQVIDICKTANEARLLVDQILAE